MNRSLPKKKNSQGDKPTDIINSSYSNGKGGNESSILPKVNNILLMYQVNNQQVWQQQGNLFIPGENNNKCRQKIWREKKNKKGKSIHKIKCKVIDEELKVWG